MKINVKKLLCFLALAAPFGAFAQAADKAKDAAATAAPMTTDELLLVSIVAVLGLLIIGLLAMIVVFGDYVYMEYKKSNEPIPVFIKFFGMIRGDYSWVAGNTTDVVIEGHDYDGIEEFDNDLPRWWIIGFYITVAFAVAYLGYYHYFKAGDLQTAEFNKEIAAAKEKYADVDLKYDAPESDAVKIGKAQATFEKTCATCHGKDAKGLSGPNLTDAEWLYGGNINDVYTTVKYGRKGKSVMPPWGAKFSNEEIYHLASFVLSLNGKGGNAPAPATTDSTAKDSLTVQSK